MAEGVPEAKTHPHQCVEVSPCKRYNRVLHTTIRFPRIVISSQRGTLIG